MIYLSVRFRKTVGASLLLGGICLMPLAGLALLKEKPTAVESGVDFKKLAVECRTTAGKLGLPTIKYGGDTIVSVAKYTLSDFDKTMMQMTILQGLCHPMKLQSFCMGEDCKYPGEGDRKIDGAIAIFSAPVSL